MGLSFDLFTLACTCMPACTHVMHILTLYIQMIHVLEGVIRMKRANIRSLTQHISLQAYQGVLLFPGANDETNNFENREVVKLWIGDVIQLRLGSDLTHSSTYQNLWHSAWQTVNVYVNIREKNKYFLLKIKQFTISSVPLKNSDQYLMCVINIQKPNKSWMCFS